MKIQFGEKGDVSWDVLLEALERENQHQEKQQHPQDYKRSCVRSVQHKCCGGSWLSIVFIITVVTISQASLILYLISTSGALYTPVGHLRHVHFSWSNCGDVSDPVQLKQLQVQPDPLLIKRNISLNLNSFLTVDVDAPISAIVKVERRIGWLWVKLPCLDELGSCHYEDLCKLVPLSPTEPCPDPFPRFKLPCRCPLSKGHYSVQDGVFSIPGIADILPAWLVSGDYYIHGTAYKDGRRLGCYTLYISVSY
ncbi:Ganglioside GM2 activator-like [Homarus americanus]|uniref:Ganglioside GM2 activator-like n=1 Tax=Homarus americanus TaxID=6706 RepID=A0A8J5K0C0_HOMAM|nr:Ganglioside GM2 activator-like [Homarus americanus]